MSSKTRNTRRVFSSAKSYRLRTHTGTDSVTHSPVSVVWNDSVTSEYVQRNYRRIIASGGNATTDSSGVERVATHVLGSDCRIMTTNTAAPGQFTEYTFSGFKFPNSYLTMYPSSELNMVVTPAENQALTSFYSNVNHTRSKFQGLVFVGELPSALRMVRSPASALRRGIGNYLTHVAKRGRRVPKRSRLRWLEDTWLEYAYGWAPLVSDLDSAIRAFYQKDAVKPIFEMVSGRGTKSRMVTALTSQAFFTQGTRGISGNADETEEVTVKYFGVNHSTGNGLPQSVHQFGFSPTDFIPTLWELVPYSFLVDYFTNVGKILESWSYRSLFHGWTAKTTYRQSVFRTTNVRIFGPSGVGVVNSISGDPGSLTLTKKAFTRLKTVPLSIPTLELKVPGRWHQWVNILALSKGLSRARESLRS